MLARAALKYEPDIFAFTTVLLLAILLKEDIFTLIGSLPKYLCSGTSAIAVVIGDPNGNGPRFLYPVKAKGRI